MTITNHLRAERESRTPYQRLRSRELAAAFVSASVLPQQVLWGQTMKGYGEWNESFGEKYEDLWGSVRKTSADHRELYESALENGALDEAKRAIGLSRNAGVSGRWAFEQLFAREGGSDVQGRLGYWDYAGGQDRWVSYGGDQLDDLAGGGKVQHGGVTLEGHHKVGVSPSVDAGQFENLGDPENIRLQSAESHLHSSRYGHGGSFRNPTTGDADEVTTGYRSVLKGKFEGAREQVYDVKAEVGLVAGLVAGSIASAVRLYQLRNDPRPWKQKAGLAAVTFAARGAEAAAIAVSALVARQAVAGAVGDSAVEMTEWLSDSAVGFVADLGDEASATVITDLLGSAGGIGAALVLRSGFRFAQDVWSGRDAREAASEMGQHLVVIGGEQLAFTALGLVLDAVTPIPDPIIGPTITAARITYSMGKMAVNYAEEQKSQRECAQRRVDTFYEIAVTALAA